MITKVWICRFWNSGVVTNASCMVTFFTLSSEFLISDFFEVCRCLVDNDIWWWLVHSTLLYLLWSDVALVEVSFDWVIVLFLWLAFKANQMWTPKKEKNWSCQSSVKDMTFHHTIFFHNMERSLGANQNNLQRCFTEMVAHGCLHNFRPYVQGRHYSLSSTSNFDTGPLSQLHVSFKVFHPGDHKSSKKNCMGVGGQHFL